MNRTKRQTVVWALTAAFAATAGAAQAAQPCQEFSALQLRLEQNATDGDFEVVLFVKGQDDGLKLLKIRKPGSGKVAKLVGYGDGIGLREFTLESAEPEDLDKVLASFPAGEYKIRGRTVEGACIRGAAVLSHQLAPATELLSPMADEVVPVDQVVLSWAPVAEAELYIVELKNEDLGNTITFEVLPPTTQLAIPVNMLVAGNAYQFGVVVVAADGNKTGVERSFSTAE